MDRLSAPARPSAYIFNGVLNALPRNQPGNGLLMTTQGVSVIIPTFNRAHLVPRAVKSALAAVRPEDEIIVADDGSTDNTAQVLAEFQSRIRYVQFPHGGGGPTRNRALTLASRPFVAFIDSDDEWMPDKLTLQREFMARRPDVLFSFTDLIVQMDTGEVLRNHIQTWHNDPRSWDEILGPGVLYSSAAPLPPGRADFQVFVGSIYLSEMAAHYVSTITMMIRREEAGAALRFAEDLPLFEDKECIALLAQAGKAAYLDCELAIAHGHSGPRLTDANGYARTSAWLTILNRVWGKDSAFVAQHGHALERFRRQQLLTRARWLMVRGRSREARADLRSAGMAPLSYRMLAALPGPVTKGLLNMRRMVRGAKSEQA